MPISPSKSRDLADENNKILMEWKWFETTVLGYMIKAILLVMYDKMLTIHDQLGYMSKVII